MQLPLELSFRGLDKTQAMEDLIRRKVDHLERVCDYISGCRVVVEKPQAHQAHGIPYRVRIDITVPPGHEIVAERGPARGDVHEQLQHVMRETFAAAERQLKELVEKQRGQVKSHPQQEAAALVKALFSEEDYGFLRTVDGREIYFHRHSVVGDQFDNLEVGTGVRYVEVQGEKGPQATTVQIVSHPPRE